MMLPPEARGDSAMRLVYTLLIAIGVVGSACQMHASDDYPPARWVPAYSGNYTVSSRPSTYPIWYVIIHVVQGSYNSCISWFQNPSSRVSAHYVIRSSDGEVTQMVRHKDIAWHAGNWWYNCRSIGIEHEGWVDDPKWFTYAMYYSSAALVRHICRTYGIPRTRSYILGHVEVPGATHTDPGPNWDWDFYMQMVQSSAILEEASVPSNLRPGEVASARLVFRNTGDITWQPTGAKQTNGGKWNWLGRYQFVRGGGFVYLRPNAPLGYVVIADAVRIVGPVTPARR
jgi:N-acetyl-anhydromuramyl-L-alanine amidase AmpD